MQWTQVYAPISGSLGLSAIAAALPIIVLFIIRVILFDFSLKGWFKRRKRQLPDYLQLHLHYSTAYIFCTPSEIS